MLVKYIIKKSQRKTKRPPEKTSQIESNLNIWMVKWLTLKDAHNLLHKENQCQRSYPFKKNSLYVQGKSEKISTNNGHYNEVAVKWVFILDFIIIGL